MVACGSHAAPVIQAPQNLRPGVMQPMDAFGGPSARLNILLGDAAPNLNGERLKHLDLGIKEIDAIENGQVTVLASYDTPRIVDVLAHVDDSGESVANTTVSRSEYQQLRLVVDLPSSKAIFNGHKTSPLNFLVNVATASSAGAGSTTVTTSDGPAAVDLIVTQPFSIPQSGNQTARVDFNAFESLALDSSGNLLARASLFVAPTDQMGSVGGRVLNSYGSPVTNATVVAIAADGSVGNSAFTDDKGHFAVGTLKNGTYQLVIYNDYITAAGRENLASGQTSNAHITSGPQITITGGGKSSVGTIAD